MSDPRHPSPPHTHYREGVPKGQPDDVRQKSQNPRNRHLDLKARMWKMWVRIKGWRPNQIMPILDPQIQTRKRKLSQTENLADGVHELLPRYAF